MILNRRTHVNMIEYRRLSCRIGVSAHFVIVANDALAMGIFVCVYFCYEIDRAIVGFHDEIWDMPTRRRKLLEIIEAVRGVGQIAAVQLDCSYKIRPADSPAPPHPY